MFRSRVASRALLFLRFPCVLSGTHYAPGKLLCLTHPPLCRFGFSSTNVLRESIDHLSKEREAKKVNTEQADGKALASKSSALGIEVPSLEETFGALTVNTNDDHLTSIVGLDCEMVWVTAKGKKALARATIVNARGEVVYDRFVRVEKEVVDYRTKYSGITAEHLVGAPSFPEVQKDVRRILKGRTVVGHGLRHDFMALKLRHPFSLIRDTASYFSDGNTPKLSALVETHLDKSNFQKGEHDSAEDARAALAIYIKHRPEWEKRLRESDSKSAKQVNEERKLTDDKERDTKFFPY